MNLDARQNRIEAELSGGVSYFRSLQADWQEHGKDQVEFVTLFEVKEQSEDPDFDYQSFLEEKLEGFLTEYHPYGDNGYNHPRKLRL